MFKIERGATRIVFIFKTFVIKIPSFKQYNLFLHGLLANLQENLWTGQHPDLAKVHFCGKLGFFLVMEKAEVLSNHVDWGETLDGLREKYKDDELSEFMLSDFKPSNWGYVNCMLKKIDYGN